MKSEVVKLLRENLKLTKEDISDEDLLELSEDTLLRARINLTLAFKNVGFTARQVVKAFKMSSI